MSSSIDELPRDHWVSRGYQQNFAALPEKRVAIFDVRRGAVIDPRRPIKSNFRDRGFTTFLEAGVPNDLLERAFASVESRVLNEIRRISSAHRGPQQRADVANLFAVHLVRSPGFKVFHSHISNNYRAKDVPAFAADPGLHRRFKASEGHAPGEGELLELTTRVYDEMVADPMHLVSAMIRQHDSMAGMLNRFHMQIVELDAHLPGYMIGDTPIAHASTSTGQFGFRDHLALGDANFIIGPLTRRTAVCFTARPLPPVQITTRKKLDAINATFLRAAQAEVACHPDDARAIRQTHSRLDRLPVRILTG